MGPFDVLADMIVQHAGLVEMTLADFSDADMLVRPVPSANHALWQLGHLVRSTTHLASLVSGVTLPPGAKELGDKFGKGTDKSDDPKAFAPKADLIKALKDVSAAMAAAVRKLNPQELGKETPPEVKGFAPTVGAVIGITPGHLAMHVGQFQVIRRKLGKPIMF